MFEDHIGQLDDGKLVVRDRLSRRNEGGKIFRHCTSPMAWLSVGSLG
jgi:hypothetical protein